MKLLLLGAMFGVLAFGQTAGQSMPPPGNDNPEFSLFTMPDLVEPSSQAIAGADVQRQAQADNARLQLEAEIRSRQCLSLGLCFTVLAVIGILGPALVRLLKISVANVAMLPGSSAWRELQAVDLCGRKIDLDNTVPIPSVQALSSKRFEDPWLDRLLLSKAGNWLDKIPGCKYRLPELDRFLESAKFLDLVPKYFVPE